MCVHERGMDEKDGTPVKDIANTDTELTTRLQKEEAASNRNGKNTSGNKLLADPGGENPAETVETTD